MMRAIHVLVRLCLAFCLVPITPVFAAPPRDTSLDQRHRFDIHVQPLDSGLRQLSTQSGVRILFPYDAVATIRGRRVEGWLSTRDALKRLLAGTSLKMAQAGVGVVALAAPGRAVRRPKPLSVVPWDEGAADGHATAFVAPASLMVACNRHGSVIA
ncbi:hypothetical protein [Sphingobium sp.]|uniref:hypothetical protein n=1 Tax=Sphingobium sp. TaxID=1912891 RepID=UPI003BB71490